MGMLRFSWDLTYICNYRCPYCWWDPHWEGLERTYPDVPPARKWIECWDRIGRKYGSVEIEILGGEPLIYPDFTALAGALSRTHRLNVTTNLSVSGDFLDRLLDAVRIENFRMAASYHPQFATFDEFLGKVTRLWDRGVKTPVLLVAYPSNLDRFPEYRDALGARHIPLTVWVYNGSVSGKRYPDSYLPREWELIKSLIPEARSEYNLGQRMTLGKPCYTGHLYANVKPDGEVFRCGQAATKKVPMGNLFDPAFDLLPGPTPCPMKQCVCSEYVYLVEEWDKNHEEVASVK